MTFQLSVGYGQQISAQFSALFRYYEKRGVMLYERDVKPQSQNMLMVEVVELVGRKNVYHQQSGTVTLEPR